MSSHLTRSAVVAAATAALVIATMGSAAALVETAVPAAAASGASRVGTPVAVASTYAGPARQAVASAAPASTAATVTAAATTRTTATAAAKPATKAAAPRKSAARSAATAAPARAAARPASRSVAGAVTIRSYVDAPGSQHAIDACHLVLWTAKPLWLAGHNWCGYQWLASVRTGTVITVTGGRAAGRYVVTGHQVLPRQSGPLPRVSADLVLQTCVGHGTGLTFARRL